MGLFRVENHLPVINPEIRAIPEIKKIISRDKDRKKSTAFSELLYIFFVYDYRTPYAKYSFDERTEHAARACQLPKGWKPDADLKKAIKLYNELQETAAIKSLKSTREALITASNVVKTLHEAIDEEVVSLQQKEETPPEIVSEDDYDSVEEYEKARDAVVKFEREAVRDHNDRITSLVENVKLLIMLSSKLPDAIGAVDKLEDQVKQEQSSGRKIKGKGEVGLFEEA